MHRLLAKLDKELKKYAEKDGELSAADWKCVYEAIEARKNLLTGMAMTGEDVNGNYDDMDEWSGRGYSRRGRSMMGESRRGRDSMGRYSANGYSGHGGDVMLDSLYEMLEDAETPEERKMIQRRINKMEGRYS